MKKQDLRVYGNNSEFLCDSNITGINNNAIICGGTGSGKTMSILEPTLLNTYNSSLIVTVTKRRLIDTYSKIFKERGYKVLELNFVEPQKSNCSFELFDYVKTDEDLDYLAQSIALIGDDVGYKSIDPFWDFASTSLLRAFLGYEYYRKKEDNKPSLSNALKELLSMEFYISRDGVETNFDADFNSLYQSEPKFDKSFNAWKSASTACDKTFMNVFNTLASRINSLANHPAINQTNKKKIKINSFGDNKTILFIVTSPVDKTMNSYVNIIYSYFFKALFEYAEKQKELKLRVPVQIICDDFATGAPIKSFPEYISIIREKNISTMILIQSETQLAQMYGKQNAITIINNCDTYVYMGGMDIETVRSISIKANLPMDEIMYMRVGDIIIIRRGERPIYTERYKIFETDLYKKVIHETKEKGERNYGK